MDPVTLVTVLPIIGAALHAAYWGTRLYRLYRIKRV